MVISGMCVDVNVRTDLRSTLMVYTERGSIVSIRAASRADEGCVRFPRENEIASQTMEVLITDASMAASMERILECRHSKELGIESQKAMTPTRSQTDS